MGLVSDMDIERLKELKQQIKGVHDGINGDDLNLLYDLLPLVDAAIARQSVKSEEVAEAIEVLEKQNRGTRMWAEKINDGADWEKLIKINDLAITALQAYQPTISKTEATSCEWCEIASACEYEVTFFKDDDRWATERSLLPKFCPNCGRRLGKL